MKQLVGAKVVGHRVGRIVFEDVTHAFVVCIRGFDSEAMAVVVSAECKVRPITYGATDYNCCNTT